mgnify:CR=1 FL=1
MIRLTKQTDYGFVMLAHIARTDSRQLHQAHSLSEETRIPEPMVRKILKILAREEILESTRGVKGGYRLGFPADQISAARVIEALEGPIALTECSLDGDSNCTLEGSCGVSYHLRRINQAIRDALARMTVADLAAEPAELVPAEEQQDYEAERQSAAG